MKTTIEGSTFASRIKPLTAKVLWHEGIDYDKIMLSMAGKNGKMYLYGYVEQPTSKLYMQLNLDGAESVTGEGASADSGPIATGTEVCQEGESFVMKWTDLSNVNRNVGMHDGVYLFDEENGLTVDTGISRLTKPCRRMMSSGIVFPHPQKEGEPLTGGAYIPMGSIDALKLSTCIDAAIRVSSLAGRRGELRAQAIHLSISEHLLNVEAISSNGAIIGPVETGQNSLPQAGKDIHIAISREDARTLKLISDLSGETIWWTYDSASRVITFSSNHYAIIAATEDVAQCMIPYKCPDDYHNYTMKCKDLYCAARKVKVAGHGTIDFSSSDEGALVTCTGDGAVESVISMHAEDKYVPFDDVTLPVDTLLAILGAYKADVLTLTVGTDNYINLITADEITGIVYLV